MKKPILSAVVTLLCSISLLGQKLAVPATGVALAPVKRAAFVGDAPAVALSAKASATIAANQSRFSDGSILLSQVSVRRMDSR
jgi:hypothetical protein